MPPHPIVEKMLTHYRWMLENIMDQLDDHNFNWDKRTYIIRGATNVPLPMVMEYIAGKRLISASKSDRTNAIYRVLEGISPSRKGRHTPRRPVTRSTAKALKQKEEDSDSEDNTAFHTPKAYKKRFKE